MYVQFTQRMRKHAAKHCTLFATVYVDYIKKTLQDQTKRLFHLD